MRYNPISQEWVVVAAKRSKRPVLPRDTCPFCPGIGKVPKDYDVFVYQNDFPSMSLSIADGAFAWADGVPDGTSASSGRKNRSAAGLYLSKPSLGACEVILYSPNHTANIYDLEDWHIEKLVRCWQARTEALGSIEGIRYVFIFENRGEAVGVTIHHPHGQIYAFPFVPRLIQREIASCRAYMEEHSSCLICDMLESELRLGVRVVSENEHFVCVIPYFARFPYEAHIVSRRHFGSIVELGDAEVLAFGSMLQDLVRGYDRLFGFAAAYIMAIHQAPTDGGDYSAYHFHVEFYPAHADSKTRKHLSGTEIGIDVFVNPSDIEANAGRLKLAIQSL
ncbi:galactose-1-phosphate uridylyltransferase [bacterium]|nr:galactose-1-phosphate uridylyltransferase [bacterium]